MSQETINELLAERARCHPDAVFIHCDAGQLSWLETLRRTRQLAGMLSREGVGSGDHVAIVCGNGAAPVLAWFAANLLGAVAVPINPVLPAKALAAVMRQCAPKCLVIEEAVLKARVAEFGEFAASASRLAFNDDEHLLALCNARHEAEPDATVWAGAPATVLFTSGTTGDPKGVVNSHMAYVACGKATARALDMGADDRIMVVLPLFHANPQMYAVMSCLHSGAGLVIRPKFSASSFFEDARRFGVTGFTFVGTLLAMLRNRVQGTVEDHGVRFAVGGGATPEVWTDVENRFGFRVHELYGMTEIGGWVTANSRAFWRLGSCGKPRGDVCVRVVDERDRPVRPGTRGEIVVRPIEPFVILSEYLNNSKALADSVRNLWFHTGDIGSFDEDGFLYFHGRLKDIIRRGGENISPAAIEIELLAHPAVEEVTVVGVPDEIFGEEIKAVLILKDAISAKDFDAFVSTRLPAFMRPRYMEVVDSIPKTETQKAKRSLLQAFTPATVDLRDADRTLGRRAAA